MKELERELETLRERSEKAIKQSESEKSKMRKALTELKKRLEQAQVGFLCVNFVVVCVSCW